MGKAPSRDYKYVDIYREKPMKVSVKVLVPVREHPKVWFVYNIKYIFIKQQNEKHAGKNIEIKIDTCCSLTLLVNFLVQKATL